MHMSVSLHTYEHIMASHTHWHIMDLDVFVPVFVRLRVGHSTYMAMHLIVMICSTRVCEFTCTQLFTRVPL